LQSESTTVRTTLSAYRLHAHTSDGFRNAKLLSWLQTKLAREILLIADPVIE
jgi:hypothetical protein